MDFVALTTLATTSDVEAPLLAADLGITAYESRQKLAGGLPAVVLVTGERARTTSLVRALEARGHGVVACEGRAVVSSSAMTQVRRFRFDPDAFVVEMPGGEPEDRTPYGEVLALVHGSHRHSVTSHEETKEKKFRPVAALATGGVILTKTVTKDVVRTAEDKEQVLYIFRRGQKPCLLREGTAHYASLGDAALATRALNFQATLRLLRERAPGAPYDERLLSLKKSFDPPNDPGAPRAFDRETGGADLLAHLLAMSLVAPAR